MGLTLTLDGDDFSNYIVSSERATSLCNPIATLSLEMSHDLPRDILPYEDVVFYENGTKVLTGYTNTFVKSRLPIGTSLVCNDVLIKTKDYWFTDILIAHGEPVTAWITRFLNMAGLNNVSIEVEETYTVFPGFGWQYMTSMEAIKSLLKMSPYQIYADPDGKVIITQINRNDTADHTVEEYIEYERIYNDSYIRNRIVIFGNGFAASVSESNEYLLPGEVRTAAAGTGQIHYESTAYDLANRMLIEYSEPWDEKIVSVEGEPTFELGQIVSFTDNETGYSKSNCVLTDITSTYNEQSGYRSEIVLDRKCVNFWGWDFLHITSIPTLFYAGTEDDGVYISFDYAENWEEANGADSILNNTYIYDLKICPTTVGTPRSGQFLWAVADNELYLTQDGAVNWSKITVPNIYAPFTLKVWAVAPSKVSESTAWILTTNNSDDEIAVMKTEDYGESWSSYEIEESALTTIFTRGCSNLIDVSVDDDAVYVSAFADGSPRWYKIEPDLSDYEDLASGIFGDGYGVRCDKLDKNKGWYFGDFGYDVKIYRTPDAGTTIEDATPSEVNSDGIIVDVLSSYSYSENALAFDNEALEIWSTDNTGISWTKLEELMDYPIHSGVKGKEDSFLVMIGRDTVWDSGTEGSIYYTEDYGITWEEKSNGLPEDTGVTSIQISEREISLV